MKFQEAKTWIVFCDGCKNVAYAQGIKGMPPLPKGWIEVSKETSLVWESNKWYCSEKCRYQKEVLDA